MRRRFFQSMFRRPSVEEVSASGTFFFLFLVACAIGFLVWWYDRVNTVRWDVLQTLLGLPGDIDRSRFTPSRVDKSFEALRPGTAEATFSDAQLRDYVDTLANASVRPPGPLSINGTPVVSYSLQSLNWSKLPLPQKVGNRQLEPNPLFSESEAPASDLRVFCLAFQDPRAWNDPSPKLVYLAKACTELGPTERASFVVMAVMNMSTKTLQVRVE
jgi:hypothetical protein